MFELSSSSGGSCNTSRSIATATRSVSSSGVPDAVRMLIENTFDSKSSKSTNGMRKTAIPTSRTSPVAVTVSVTYRQRRHVRRNQT